jgi:uncharacterized membrane protein
MSKRMIWNEIVIDGHIFRLEELQGEVWLARHWDKQNEVYADSSVTRWETAGGAAQELLNMIQQCVDDETKE